jgi:hypothetical protein
MARKQVCTQSSQETNWGEIWLNILLNWDSIICRQALEQKCNHKILFFWNPSYIVHLQIFSDIGPEPRAVLSLLVGSQPGYGRAESYLEPKKQSMLFALNN